MVELGKRLAMHGTMEIDYSIACGDAATTRRFHREIDLFQILLARVGGDGVPPMPQFVSSVGQVFN
jgi:hypothetical protein